MTSNLWKSTLCRAVFVACALVGNACFSAEYYVDSKDGADVNSGTSPEQAWKTLKKVNGAKLEPGDSVLFRRDRVWRGTLVTKQGEKGRPVVYGSYGEGEKPRILSSADLSDPALWSRVGDDLWATPETGYRDASTRNPETAKFAVGKWSLYTEAPGKGKISVEEFADLGGAKGWRVDCEAQGGKSSRFQVTNEGFPVVADRFIAVRARMRSTKPFTLAPGDVRLMMRGKPWSSYGSTLFPTLEIGAEWKEFDVVFDVKSDANDGRITMFLGETIPDGARFEFAFDAPREVEAVGLQLGGDVGNLVFTEPGAVRRAKDPATKKFAPSWDKREYPGFKRWTLEDVKENGDFWYDIDAGRVYLKLDANPGEKYASIEAVLRPHCCVCSGHDVVVENLALTHTGAHGARINQGERVVIRDCDFDWIGGGDLYGTGGAGKRVRFGNGVEVWDGSIDCAVERCRFTRVYDTATTTQGNGEGQSLNLTIRDCVMDRCEQSFEIWFTNPEFVLKGCVFERNLCIDTGRGWSHVQRPDKTATPILGYGLDCKTVDVTVRENIFCDTLQYFVKLWNNRIKEYRFDNNVYWVWEDREHLEGDNYFCYDASHGKKPMNFDEYRKETGQDEHSKWVKPRFRYYEKGNFELINRDELQAGPLPK